MRGCWRSAAITCAAAMQGARGPWLGVTVALLGAWILFKTQLDILDGVARAITDMLWTGSRRLRKSGKVPAVVYGAGQPPSAVTLDPNSLIHQMGHEGFFTSILTLKIAK